ncbi:MAG: hypothetical protein ACPIOQ_68975, partial [Promethearchaeia archaeon]
ASSTVETRLAESASATHTRLEGCERERERESVCVCVRVCARARLHVHELTDDVASSCSPATCGAAAILNAPARARSKAVHCLVPQALTHTNRDFASHSMH